MSKRTEEPDLIDLLAKASEADLAKLDTRITDKQAELDAITMRIGGELSALQSLRKVLDIKLHGKPARKKPERKAKAASATTATVEHGAPTGLAADIVACIQVHGPAFPAAIGRKLDRTEQAINMSVTKRPDLLKRLSDERIALADHEED